MGGEYSIVCEEQSVVCVCVHTHVQVKTLKHIHNNFIIHSSIHRKIGCVHILSIVNNTVKNTVNNTVSNAAMTTGVQMHL